MTGTAPLHAFAGYGIELEYMIVDRDSLAVKPVADHLLRNDDGRPVASVERTPFAWSNEIVLHLVELKNARPAARLETLADGFQAEVREIGRRLEALGARLMPTGMHPWMDPARETQLWPHEGAPVYQAYDRLFGCRRHGQANLQSMHLNLPFADDAEFARLHAAVRLVLPILPALAASSPIADGRRGAVLDGRMAAYLNAVPGLPATIGRLIPDNANSRAEYEATVLQPLYRDLAPRDPAGVLRHEWLNARGAIPRFERSALEIRVIDVQESPRADLAVAAATVATIRALYAGRWSTLATQQTVPTGALAGILHACIRDAEQALIEDAAYLQRLGFAVARCRAGELWRHLIEATVPSEDPAYAPLDAILQHGPLARRILEAVGPACTHDRILAVYRALCDCLDAGQMFLD